ncbi:UbiA family prenyltransferase [Antiquaquibacter soli]|uniref:UbiA family prenyltransferase n=1 Tax=Antiquaquibacter soli TaxID=3064523 RepID=A0ABT9BSB6_9MICO|nr:UbiA family prenyltransferase [Protaetiibacter sp. WY-16]MDO7882237.1 UbiA family prenyltransferase [Protaetiibacter sp. WY-16]
MLALARSTHPAPTLGVTLIAAVLGVASGLEPWRVAVLAAVILFNQLSVGLSNDWLDAPRDRRVGRTDKPIATGEVPERVARAWAFGTAAASILTSLALGWPAAVANLVFLGAGWAYNLGLKSTPVSVLPYALGFGALPFVVTLSRPDPAAATWWAAAAGALLGVAAHFANVIPDLEDDRATGVRGLPHRIGAQASGGVVAVALAAASLLLVLGPGDPDPLRLAGLGLSLAIAVACAALVVRRSSSRAAFLLTIAAALVAVLLLLGSGTRVLA